LVQPAAGIMSVNTLFDAATLVHKGMNSGFTEKKFLFMVNDFS